MTQMRGLRISWQCAISHVFNVSGDSVNFIYSMIDEIPLDLYIINRCVKFMQNLTCHLNVHVVLSTAFRYICSQELFRLRSLLFFIIIRLVFIFIFIFFYLDLYACIAFVCVGCHSLTNKGI